MDIRFPINICGKPFTSAEFTALQEILENHPTQTRTGISRIVCQRFSWVAPNGRLKEMSCRVALLKLHRAGLIKLPSSQNSYFNTNTFKHLNIIPLPEQPILKPVSLLGPLSLEPVVQTTKHSYLWNQLIHHYHYLRFTPLPGAQIRYFVRCPLGLLALISFSASAWKTAPRDQWIGWNKLQRQKNLHLVINNSRFLILPWVHSPHLASKILALTAKRLPRDWFTRYNYKPVLLETFVQKDTFKGACYRAANWIYVGQTKGRGKKDFHNLCPLPIKDIWLYPLHRNFKKILCNS